MLEYLHEFCFLWDSHFTVPTFDFYFKFKIPEPNKGRFIVERDKLGRIVSSNVDRSNISYDFDII